jgi:hypothetical protein
MAEQRSQKTTWNQWFREWLATLVVVVSIVGVTILAAVAILKGTEPKEIMAMVLPMIGTWVGTVLAFYFGREQLEAATRSVTAIANQLTPDQKLQSLRVTDKMIPRADMHVVLEDAANLKLVKALQDLQSSGKGSRLPILTPDGKPALVVHRSTIDGLIANRAMKGATQDQLNALTLADLVTDPQFQRLVQNTVAIIPDTATLSQAKQAMDAVPHCQDAFVTHDGSTNNPVLGWVTNVVVEANSKV